MPDDWKDTYPQVAKNIKSKNDLLKIIFEDPNIIKEGKKCSIDNWEKFVTNQHKNMLLSETEDPLWEGDKDAWWRISIYDTGRFKMDIFALLRMFRKDDPQGRFKNIIYHAGAWHTQNLALMLKQLSYHQLYNKYDNKQCMEINLTDAFKMNEQRAPATSLPMPAY